MERTTLNISGMSCGHCVGRVTRALASIGGIEVEDVKIGSATIGYDPAATSPARIAEVVTAAGYDAQPAGQSA